MAIEATRLHVLAGPSGPRVRCGGGALRAMTMGTSGGTARVALVPDRALLLAGDEVRLEVRVGAGCRLELEETAGTVAYDMRGGSARWELDLVVDAGAGCVLRALPWVSAAGSDVRRTTRVRLDRTASVVLRETLVLGRHGEPPGALSSLTCVRSGEAELLVEELDAADLAPSRVVDSVVVVGRDLPPAAPPVTRLDLEEGAGTVWRVLDTEAHRTERLLGPLMRAAGLESGSGLLQASST